MIVSSGVFMPAECGRHRRVKRGYVQSSEASPPEADGELGLPVVEEAPALDICRSGWFNMTFSALDGSRAMAGEGDQARLLFFRRQKSSGNNCAASAHSGGVPLLILRFDFNGNLAAVCLPSLIGDFSREGDGVAGAHRPQESKVHCAGMVKDIAAKMFSEHLDGEGQLHSARGDGAGGPQGFPGGGFIGKLGRARLARAALEHIDRLLGDLFRHG